MSNEAKSRWSWLLAMIPGVVALMADKRAELGQDWIKHCWQCGVIRGVPGYFWAAEGAISVGTPWDTDMVQMHHTVSRRLQGSCALFLARKPVDWSVGMPDGVSEPVGAAVASDGGATC